jgi:hypothetical protein
MFPLKLACNFCRRLTVDAGGLQFGSSLTLRICVVRSTDIKSVDQYDDSLMLSTTQRSQPDYIYYAT